MISERNLRGKKNSFLINLIETPQGLSIVEGTELLNKPQSGLTPSQHQLGFNASNSQQLILPSNKEFKSVFKKSHFIFNYSSAPASSQKTSPTLPCSSGSVSRAAAEWFNLGALHQKEKDEVARWLAEVKPESDNVSENEEQLPDWLQRYKKDRLLIVNLYNSDFLPTNSYLSASTLRRYLCCEAFWVMKIHHFLSNVGAINPQKTTQNTFLHNQKHLFRQKGPFKQLPLFDLSLPSSNSALEHDHNRTLKMLTPDLRPYCDYCQIHCGIVWFQHTRTLDSKEITGIMKNVNSKNPPLSQKQYEYILCVRCYCESRFPLLLTHHDFKKTTLNDRIDPRRKKNKGQLRQRVRKEGEQEEEQGREQEDEGVSPQAEERERKEQLNSLMKRLVSNVKGHEWTLEETLELLRLVESEGQDWTRIEEKLKEKGLCRGLEPEDLIVYFMSLPRRGLVKMKEEYTRDEFIESNLFSGSSPLSGHLLQQKMNDCNLFSRHMGEVDLETLKKATNQSSSWKEKTQAVMRSQIKGLAGKLQFIESCEDWSRKVYPFVGQRS